MAKEKTQSPDRWVRVRIHRAIALGGLALRPILDGKNIVPVEAVILASEAALHGPEYVEVIGDAPAPADGRQGLIGDQDTTPVNTQQVPAAVVNK